MGFPGESAVRNLPAMQETWVGSLGQEDPLEEGMATHSRTLVWRIPWTEEPGGLQSIGSQRVGHDCSNLAHTHPLNHSVVHRNLNSVTGQLYFKNKQID